MAIEEVIVMFLYIILDLYCRLSTLSFFFNEYTVYIWIANVISERFSIVCHR